jgi:formylglycine-generating enzyme required for sulfatase activity
MVKVGNFWIDRFEMSLVSCSTSASCPSGLSCNTGICGVEGSANGYSTTAVGCSVSGVQPTVGIDWFQAAQLCVNAGKELCSNQEWQTAVSGTTDPGSWPSASGCGNAAPTAGPCNTCGSSFRNTGLGGAAVGGSCYSAWGAEDMIGNAWEWTGDWWEAGNDSAFSQGLQVSTWPGGFGSGDSTWNVNGSGTSGSWTNGLPVAALRGGSLGDGNAAGAFTLNLNTVPAYQYNLAGARCCIRGR